jgi:hypothetical protein
MIDKKTVKRMRALAQEDHYLSLDLELWLANDYLDKDEWRITIFPTEMGDSIKVEASTALGVISKAERALRAYRKVTA